MYKITSVKVTSKSEISSIPIKSSLNAMPFIGIVAKDWKVSSRSNWRSVHFIEPILYCNCWFKKCKQLLFNWLDILKTHAQWLITIYSRQNNVIIYLQNAWLIWMKTFTNILDECFTGKWKWSLEVWNVRIHCMLYQEYR